MALRFNRACAFGGAGFICIMYAFHEVAPGSLPSESGTVELWRSQHPRFCDPTCCLPGDLYLSLAACLQHEPSNLEKLPAVLACITDRWESHSHGRDASVQDSRLICYWWPLGRKRERERTETLVAIMQVELMQQHDLQ